MLILTCYCSGCMTTKAVSFYISSTSEGEESEDKGIVYMCELWGYQKLLQ